MRKSKIIVGDIARKILGISPSIKFHDLDSQTKRDLWKINDVFRGGTHGRSPRGGYKHGIGMKMVYDYIMSK